MYTQLLNDLLQLKLIEILINDELYECLFKKYHLNKKYTLYMKTNIKIIPSFICSICSQYSSIDFCSF